MLGARVGRGQGTLYPLRRAGPGADPLEAAAGVLRTRPRTAADRTSAPRNTHSSRDASTTLSPMSSVAVVILAVIAAAARVAPLRVIRVLLRSGVLDLSCGDLCERRLRPGHRGREVILGPPGVQGPVEVLAVFDDRDLPYVVAPGLHGRFLAELHRSRGYEPSPPVTRVASLRPQP